MRLVGLCIAVFLLITSGMSLPLVSLANSPVQVQGATHSLAIREGNIVIDGTPSKFFVSAAYVIMPHPRLVDTMPGALCRPMHPPDKVALVAMDVDSSRCPSPKVLGAALAPGFFQPQGPAGGGYSLKLGLGMSEMVITPQSFTMISSLTPNVPRVWWDFFQRRSKFEIYVEILELMKRAPMTPFEVAFYARLNHKRTKEYVEFLVRSGYLHPVTEDGKVVYVLTKEGMEFLDRVKALFVGTRFIEVTNYSYQRDF